MNLSRLLKQRGVYWAVSDRARDGKKSFSTGVEISCYYEASAKKFNNPAGEELISDGVVYSDTELQIGDYFAFCDLSDLSSEPNDPQEVDSHQIRGSGAVLNIGGELTIYIAYL